MRWTASRKLEFLEKYRAGELKQADIARADMTPEELDSWGRSYDQYGLNGLKTTKIRQYGDPDTAASPRRIRTRPLRIVCALSALIAATPVANAWECDRGDPHCAMQDWDRYHARVDACAEADQIRSDCVRGWCDELTLRQADRACHAGERGFVP